MTSAAHLPGRVLLVLVLAVACKVPRPEPRTPDYPATWVVAATIDSMRPAAVALTPPARAAYPRGVFGSIQYRLDAGSFARAAHAPVPRKLKGGAVYVAPGAQVAAPIATTNGAAAAPGGTATTIGKNKGPAATAPGATASQTKAAAPWWLWLLVVAALAYIVRRALKAA